MRNSTSSTQRISFSLSRPVIQILFLSGMLPPLPLAPLAPLASSRIINQLSSRELRALSRSQAPSPR